jgi:hypothetical protein
MLTGNYNSLSNPKCYSVCPPPLPPDSLPSYLAAPSIVEMHFRKSAVDFRYSIETSNLRIVAYFSKLGNDVTSLGTASRRLAMQYQVLANAFCLVCGIARAAGPLIGFEFEYVHKF